MKIRLDFCDFWPGFPKTNNFFYNLLRERFEVEICDRPDFLIFQDLGQHVHRVHDCVKIYYCPEDFVPDFRSYDYAFSCREMADPRNLRLPFYTFATAARHLVKMEGEANDLLALKTRFCSFVVGYANAKTRVRTEFFHKLCQYKKVDSAGRALNNVGYRVSNPAEKLEFLRPYKFNIAFENAAVPGYTTEKLVESMRARCLPVYWGNPDVARDFNPASFLNYTDFPSAEALIERIIELDRDDAKYLAQFREPYFYDNQPSEFFNRERVLNQFEKIFSTPITPVSRRRYFGQIDRWIPVKKDRPSRSLPGSS